MSKATVNLIRKVTALLLVFTIALSPMVPAMAQAATDSEWGAKIRPGYMKGDDRTDSFVDYFLPFLKQNNSLFYFDINVRQDEDTDETNVGLGYRMLGAGDKYLIGANIFQDSKTTEGENTFDQIGFGLEALTKNFDARFNYYSPTGDTKEKIDGSEVYSFGPSGLLVSYEYEEARKSVV